MESHVRRAEETAAYPWTSKQKRRIKVEWRLKVPQESSNEHSSGCAKDTPRHFFPTFHARLRFPHNCIEMRLVNNTLRHVAGPHRM